MIRLVVDSASDYTKEELEKRSLIMVPLQITINNKHYRDGIDITKDGFYDILLSTKEFPKTSQPSPDAFVKVFEKAKEEDDEVICILLSSSLSGTVQSARLAKDMVDYDKIHIIDSLSATIGIRVLVEEALKMVNDGKDAKTIVDTIEDIKGRLMILAGIDTLEYLCMGGRVSKAVATIGEFANIKPIITVSKEGKVEVLTKRRGTNKTLAHLKDMIKAYQIDDRYNIFSIYSHGEDNTKRLEELLDMRIDERVQLGPTIGAHVGPGAFGVVFVTK